jgi:guanylate kinase
MYKIIAIIGEAGSGKDTLMNKVIYEAGAVPVSIFHTLISCTTRPPRDYEKNGVNYHFLTNEEFAARVLKNDFLEVSEFNNWFYGTAKSELDPNKINIAVLNPEGIENILLHDDIQLKVFYLDVKGKTRLIRQLQREENPDIPEIYRRYMADDEDFNYLPFEYETLKNENNIDFEKSWMRVLEFARNWTANDK